MTPIAPALCSGYVYHRRSVPHAHAFRYPVTYFLLDPEQPDELCRHHRLWSATHAAPGWFRAADYGDSTSLSLAAQARRDVAAATGAAAGGPVRMVTQVRLWGSLFNPITAFLVWDRSERHPVGAVLEVTNTPWRQRHRYAFPLHDIGGPPVRIPKRLHVSPFLGMELDYLVTIELARTDDRRADTDTETATDTDARSRTAELRPQVLGALRLHIDVVDADDVLLATELNVEFTPVSHSSLGRVLRAGGHPMRRTSSRIHVQAARRMAKRTAFVAHPDKRRLSTR
jgi:DUF1365 family protein